MEDDEAERMMVDDGECQDIGTLTLSMFQSSDRKRDRHLCSVVTTITQELKDKGFPLTPIAYFGATFSTVKSLFQDPSCGQDPSLEALLTFMSMIMPAVSPVAVRSRGEVVGEVMKMVMVKEMVSDGAVKAAMKCISLLIVNGDKVNWLQVAPLYKFMLSFVTDKREKVRIQAHLCLCNVLQSFEGFPLLSSASEEIVLLFQESLLAASQSNAVGMTAVPESRGVWEVLFVLNSLRDSLPLMSSKSRTKILKYFKSLVSLNQSIVTRAIVEILHALCCSSTRDVPVETMLDLLYFLALSASETEKTADAMASIARLLHVGIKKVYDGDISICTVKLPFVFSILGEILACGHEEAIFAAMEAFKGLICTCINKNLIDQGIDQINLSKKGIKRSTPTIIEKICATMESLLGYQYIEVWDISFQIISTMFDSLGESSFHLMAETLKSLANLEKLPDEELSYRKQLHECVGSAISILGPEMFLKILPLNLECNDLSENNAWMLPILKQYTVGAKLSFFKNTILVMIDHMQQRAKELESEGLIVSARITTGIVYSLWSLLPSFCNYPSDTANGFKDLHNELCDVLLKEPDLRGLICSCLQILIQQNKKIVEAHDDASVVLSIHEQKAKDRYTIQIAEENLSVLRAFAKRNLKDHSLFMSKESECSHNIIKVLSEIFLNSSNDCGGCFQFTIREYASILDKEDVKYLFKRIMKQLLAATEEAVANKNRTLNSMQIDNSAGENSLVVKRALLLDLAASLLPGLATDEVNFLSLYCIKPGVQDEEGIIQKKAYKSLSIILKEHGEFLSNNLHDVIELMVDALPSCHFSAKRYRLDSLYFIIIHLSKDTSDQLKHETISSFLTEIILALKEDNKKTRNRAYDLLVKIGHACEDEKHGGKGENLQLLFKMVAGVLGGKTPFAISAAAKGLARLAYEFSDLINEAYKFLPSAVMLLKRHNREICKASLGFMKVLVAKSQVDCLHLHLKEIVEGLVTWQDDTRKHFKAKVKLLLEMLIKKCGLDAVKVFMPEEHMKLLNNIRKITDRKGKTKSEKDTISLHSKTSSRHSRWNHTYIFSDAEDEDLDDDIDADFMDSNMVTGSRRKTRSKASSSRSKKTSRSSSKRLPGDLIDLLEDDPLDLLDGQKTRASLKSSSLTRKRKAASDDEVEINPDGRLVIHEGGRKMKREESSSSGYNFFDDTKSNSAGQYSSAKSQGKRQKSLSGWSYTGSEYKSKKAGGDIKRTNKLEPYAYWPLDRKLLNRRQESKAVARKGLSSVVKVTKKLEGKSASVALSAKGLKVKKKTHKRHIERHK